MKEWMNPEAWTTCRVSFTDDVDFHNAATTAAAHAESSEPEASHPEPARAGPPPSIADCSSVAQVSKTLPYIIT
jgi:hypothetical protein